MPEWLLSLSVGGVIMGLLGILYKNMLTKSEHADVCKANTKAVKEEISSTIKEELKDMKEYFDVKIERDILRELRRLNGRI